MSLYNLVHGENVFSQVLLSMLNLKREQIGRYRDCWYTSEGLIAVHTRTGGGNRADYEAENNALAHHAQYVSDADDDYDSTYATFYFKVPEQFLWLVPQLQAQEKSPYERWQIAIKRLSDTEDPATKRVHAALAPLFQELKKTR